MLDLSLDAVDLAPLLVGARLTDSGVTLMLTEVEAYAGSADPAAHAFPGPRPRTRHLFGPPGTLYCYLSYGIHICGNLVCGVAGGGSAVLLRAGRVVAGFDRARSRRPGVADVALARGPGNLGRVMGWTLADSGRRLGDRLELEGPEGPVVIACGPRVGVTVAHARPWRFWAGGDPTVSAYRLSPRIPRGSQDW